MFDLLFGPSEQFIDIQVDNSSFITLPMVVYAIAVFRVLTLTVPAHSMANRAAIIYHRYRSKKPPHSTDTLYVYVTVLGLLGLV